MIRFRPALVSRRWHRAAIVALALSAPALAEWREQPNAAAAIDAARKEGYTVRAITPIFSQLVSIAIPGDLEMKFEDNKHAGQYLQEYVPKGETVEKWTQMVTVTGAKGLAANPRLTPQAFLSLLAQGFNKACPASYAATGLGDQRIGDATAFAAVVSCGSVSVTDGPHSESTLMLVIKGTDDYYTIQWAVRGAASATPLVLDEAEWRARLQKLQPIKLCPIVPGEAAPYPSCADRK
jgi:hypothetical protein